MRTRVSPARVGLMLIVAACALVVFIGLLGDVRRKRTALDQMRRYGESLMIRVGEAKLLPLNLEPDPARVDLRDAILMDHLSAEEAQRFRAAAGPVIVAQTTALPTAVLPKGRAALIFQGGRFSVEWLTIDEFNRRLAKQRAATGAARPTGP